MSVENVCARALGFTYYTVVRVGFLNFSTPQTEINLVRLPHWKEMGSRPRAPGLG